MKEIKEVTLRTLRATIQRVLRDADDNRQVYRVTLYGKPVAYICPEPPVPADAQPAPAQKAPSALPAAQEAYEDMAFEPPIEGEYDDGGIEQRRYEQRVAEQAAARAASSAPAYVSPPLSNHEEDLEAVLERLMPSGGNPIFRGHPSVK